MNICQVCHRTDAFTPGKINHDKDWHKGVDARKEYEQAVCRRKTQNGGHKIGTMVSYWVIKPAEPKTFALLGAL